MMTFTVLSKKKNENEKNASWTYLLPTGFVRLPSNTNDSGLAELNLTAGN